MTKKCAYCGQNKEDSEIWGYSEGEAWYVTGNGTTDTVDVLNRWVIRDVEDPKKRVKKLRKFKDCKEGQYIKFLQKHPPLFNVHKELMNQNYKTLFDSIILVLGREFKLGEQQ